MAKTIDLTPVPADPDSAGMYHKDLVRLDLKEGHWVAISYVGLTTQKIHKKIRSVDKQPPWENDLLFLCKHDMQALKLPPTVEQAAPTSPPTGVHVTVQKLILPRELKAYLVVATFVIAFLTAIVAYCAAIAGTSSPLTPALAAAALALASATAAVSCISGLLVKQ